MTYVIHNEDQWTKAHKNTWTQFHWLFPHKLLRFCMDLVNKVTLKNEAQKIYDSA